MYVLRTRALSLLLLPPCSHLCPPPREGPFSCTRTYHPQTLLAGQQTRWSAILYCVGEKNQVPGSVSPNSKTEVTLLEQGRNSKHRGAEPLSRGHTAGERQSWRWTPRSSDTKPRPLLIAPSLWGPRLCSANPQTSFGPGGSLCPGADYGFSAPHESF